MENPSQMPVALEKAIGFDISSYSSCGYLLGGHHASQAHSAATTSPTRPSHQNGGELGTQSWHALISSTSTQCLPASGWISTDWKVLIKYYTWLKDGMFFLMSWENAMMFWIRVFKCALFRTHRLLMDPHRPSNQHSGEGTHAKDQEFIYMRRFTVRPKKIATRALHFPLGYLIQSQVFQFDVPHVMHWQLISTYLPSSAVSLWNEFQSWVFVRRQLHPQLKKNPPWNLVQ